ncbi:MAG: aminotransferase, partial [Magnetococcales bacterium]|nr:aminotransferase [Magnetococcales bacterium]
MVRNVYQAHRGAGIRFSPHFYQDETDVARALAAVAEVLSGGKST